MNTVCAYLSLKILSVTCDNASNNDTMIAKMGSELTYFKGEQSRCRCFAHVINLVVKSILQPFEKSGKGTDAELGQPDEEPIEGADEEEDDDYGEPDKVTGWQDERDNMPE